MIKSDLRIKWPEGLHPSDAPVFSHNEITADVPAENVWAWLVEASKWHEFYTNSWKVKVHNKSGRLEQGTQFSWWTFGIPVKTTVEVFEKEKCLAWSGIGLGSKGYHVWLIDKTATGCKIITEETQSGPVVKVLSPILNPLLHYFHQRWLEGLAKVSGKSP